MGMKVDLYLHVHGDRVLWWFLIATPLLRLAIDFETRICIINQILSLSTVLCLALHAYGPEEAYLHQAWHRQVVRGPSPGRWGGDPHLNLTIFAGQRSGEPLGICLTDQHRPCVAQAKSFILFFHATPGNRIPCLATPLPAEVTKGVHPRDFPVSFPPATSWCSSIGQFLAY